jgi:glutamate-1-semialdehyde aminotransferase
VARYTVSFPTGDLDALARLLDEHRGQVAAVFTDLPYDGSLGAEYLREVQRLAHDHGALLCFDEIVHGFRLARGGMQEHFGVLPDLACFAKGIANGLPLAVVVGRRELMAHAASSLISLTYGGEALSLAACIAVLREYRERDVIGHLWRIGQRLMDGLNAAATRAGVPFRCLGYPSMSAMELRLPRERVGPAWELLLAESARRGALFRRGGLNMITFSHHEADVDEAVHAAAGAFEALRAAGFTAAAGREAGVAAGGDQSGSRGQQVGPWAGAR